MNFLKLASLVAFAISLGACATEGLNKGGERVQMVSTVDNTKCTSIGMAIGQGGGAFGGAYISNNDLVEYAYNDLRNRAAEKGATHVIAQGPQLGGSSGTTTTATVAGNLYRCK